MGAKDGGSAFPQIETRPGSSITGTTYSNTYSHGGMSLRDYFAGQALSSPHDMTVVFKMAHEAQCRPTQMLARICYDWADEMLAAREAVAARAAAGKAGSQ